jgi:MoxR-like ATPase
MEREVDGMGVTEESVNQIADTYAEILKAAQRYVVGNEPLIQMTFIGILTEGAVLLEGVPGTAKTTIAKIMARLLSSSFRRVQGAVDVQPADILGVRIFSPETGKFVLQKGPVFSNVLLVDEVNRLTPKTQSALLEAMSEHQVTIDGETYPLPKPYIVLATQNPYEFEGTFSLVEAQRDRFMFSLPLSYLDSDDELELLRRDQTGRLHWIDYEVSLAPLLTPEEIARMIGVVRQIYASEAILHYIADIVAATRTHGDIRLGASARGSLALLRGAKAHAALQGRTYVIPDDVKAVTPAVLGHRLILEREALIGDVTTGEVVREILQIVEVS